MSPEAIIKNAGNLGFPSTVPWTDPITWSTVVEDHSDQPFLSEHPLDILKSGDFNTDVEIIMGTNNDEDIAFLSPALTDPSMWQNYADTWDSAGARVLFGIADPKWVTEKDIANANRALEFYVGSKDGINEGLKLYHIFPKAEVTLNKWNS